MESVHSLLPQKKKRILKTILEKVAQNEKVRISYTFFILKN